MKFKHVLILGMLYICSPKAQAQQAAKDTSFTFNSAYKALRRLKQVPLSR